MGFGELCWIHLGARCKTRSNILGPDWGQDRSNLKRTKCIPEASSSSTNRKSQSESSTENVVPTNRLRQKTTESEIRGSQASSSTGDNPLPVPLSNEQPLLSVPGHDDPSREWMRYLGTIGMLAPQQDQDFSGFLRAMLAPFRGQVRLSYVSPRYIQKQREDINLC